MPGSLWRSELGAGSYTTFPPALKATRRLPSGMFNSAISAAGPPQLLSARSTPRTNSPLRMQGLWGGDRPGPRTSGRRHRDPTPQPRPPSRPPARRQTSPRPWPPRSPGRVAPRAAGARPTRRPGPAPSPGAVPAARPAVGPARPGPALSGLPAVPGAPPAGPVRAAAPRTRRPGTRYPGKRPRRLPGPRQLRPRPGPGGSRLSGRTGPPLTDGQLDRPTGRKAAGLTHRRPSASPAPGCLGKPGLHHPRSPPSSSYSSSSSSAPQRRSPATAPPPLPHSPRPSTHSGSSRPAQALLSESGIR